MRWLTFVALFSAVLAGGVLRAGAQDYSNSLALVYNDGDGNSLAYRLFLPPGYDTPGAQFPLVMHLHGAGERGNNNTSQLFYIDGLIEETRTEHPAFLLVPQAPLNTRWDNFGSASLSLPAQMALDVIDLVEQQYSVDTSRRYATGLSLGGFGVWDLLGKRPGFFDTAFPLSGYGEPARAEQYLDSRIWTFHGGNDGTVPVVPKRQTVQAIRDAGGNPIYSEVNGGHGIWQPIYDDPIGELYDWVFDGITPEIATFQYDPTDGTIRIDASKAPGGFIDSFRYSVNNFNLFDVPDTVLVDGSPIATSDFFLATNTRELIYSNRDEGGFTGVLEIPGLLSSGLDFLSLSTLTTQWFYFSPETDTNRRAFNVTVGTPVPEPTGALLVLAALGCFGFTRRRAR